MLAQFHKRCFLFLIFDLICLTVIWKFLLLLLPQSCFWFIFCWNDLKQNKDCWSTPIWFLSFVWEVMVCWKGVCSVTILSFLPLQVRLIHWWKVGLPKFDFWVCFLWNLCKGCLSNSNSDLGLVYLPWHICIGFSFWSTFMEHKFPQNEFAELEIARTLFAWWDFEFWLPNLWLFHVLGFLFCSTIMETKIEYVDGDLWTCEHWWACYKY